MNHLPLLLFDGECGLCQASVRWIVDRDRMERLHFASLQSRAGRAYLAEACPGLDPPDSMVLIDASGARVRSDAAIATARLLGFPWSLAALGVCIPRAWRDRLYDWIAARRHRLFPTSESCFVPDESVRRRFLDLDE